MYVSALAELPQRLARLNFRLLSVVVAASLLPASLAAQTTIGGSNPITISGTYTQSESSTVSVTSSSLPSSDTVTAISVNFTGVNVHNLNSVAMVLVSPGGTALDLLSGVCGEGTQQVGYSSFSLADTGATGSDNVGGMVPYFGGTCPSTLSGTYLGTDYFPGEDSFSPGPSSYDSAGPGTPTCSGLGVSCGSYSFSTAYGLPISASSLQGTWTLYIASQDNSGEFTPSGSLSSWTITFTTTSAAATTTALSTSNNGQSTPVYTSGDVNGDSLTGTQVTLTATVTSGGTPVSTGGTVTFYDSTGKTAGSGTQLSSPVALNGSGQAQLNFIFPASEEGTRSLSAVYSGDTDDSSSISQTLNETTVNHPYNPSGTTYCNGPVTMGDNSSASLVGTGGFPFPSQIILSGVTGTIEDLTVTLNGLQVEDPQFMGLLLAGPNSNAFEFLGWADGDGPGSNNLTNLSLTLSDAGSGLLQTSSDNQESCTAGSPCLPADDYSEVGPLYTDAFPSPAPTTTGKASPTGLATFTSQFAGSGANGTWQLYLNNWLSESTSTNGSLPYGQLGEWCLNLTMQTSAHATTLAASGSPNPATFSSGTTAAVTLSAQVTVTDSTPLSDDSNPGTVTFVDGSTNLGSAPVAGNGAASLTADLTEGTHQITATYSGTSTGTEFGISTATFGVRVNKTTTNSGSGAGPYAYCNSGSITAPGLGLDYGAAAPYPSNILVSGLPGTVDSVSVQLNNFTTRDQGDLMSLLVGPDGSNSSSNLEFFSLTGNNSDTVSGANLTFSDTGSTFSGLFSSGTYKPESYNTNITYPQCPQNAPLCGSETVGPPLGSNPTFTPTNKAESAGTGILGDISAAGVFGGTTSSTYNGNGTWSLYIDDGGPTGDGETTTIGGGWCLNFTVNLPSISFSGPAPSTFTQGGTGSLPAVTITNNGINGAGSIGDPAQSTANAMTVIDTLPSGLSYASATGTDWSCSALGQVVTCTNEDTVAVNNTYSPLTINVSISGFVSGAIGSNSVSVSDTQAANTPTPQTGSVTIDVPPSITSASSTTFTAGVGGNFTVTTSPTAYPTPSLGEAGSLPGTVTFTNNGNGTATIAGTATVAGNYQITITASNGASPNATQSFTLTVSPAAPATITANSSTTPQLTPINTAFAVPLSVTALDAFGNPVPGVSVTFTAPASGASGTFSNSTNTITVNTDPTGIATAGTFTANSAFSDTPYTVTAAGSSLSASFSLTNVIGNYLWIGNPAGTTSAFLATGVPYLSAEATGGTAVAVDSSGNVWTLNAGGASVSEFSDTGTVVNSGYSGGGLVAGTSLAIDGLNQVWITNSSGGTVSVFNSTGTPVSSAAYTVGSSSPTSTAIDISGNLWIANSGANSVTKVLGAAAPTVPLTAGVANGSPATEP